MLKFKKYFDGLYSISNTGTIKRNFVKNPNGHKRKERILKPSISKGYYHVTLVNGSKRKTVRIHKLVAKLFIGKCPVGKQINHIDGNKLNNNSNNLEYVTCKENILHAKRLGLASKYPNRKLSDTQILAIKGIKVWPHGLQRRLAQILGVTDTIICSIRKGRVWNDLR